MNTESEGSQLSGLTLGHRRQKKAVWHYSGRLHVHESYKKKSYYQKTKRTSFPIRLPLVTGLFKQPAVYVHIRECLQKINIFN